VYDAAKSSVTPSAAAIEPDNSAATSTVRPQAAAASIADARFNACAGDALVSHSIAVPIAK